MTKTGGKINRIEPQGADLVDANSRVRSLFMHSGWYPLCTRLGSSNSGVAQEFANYFNGQEATVYGLTLHVSEDSIVEAFNLPKEGERWFKGKFIARGDLNNFLKDAHIYPNWEKGISSNLKNDWAEAIKLIKIYLTCERRYTVVFLYHMRFLFHIARMKTLNLPFFLLKILTRMSERVLTHVDVSEYSLYHQDLIKVLVEEYLRKRNQTWDHFLFYKAGQPAPTPPVPQPNPQPAKRRTKRKAQK